MSTITQELITAALREGIIVRPKRITDTPDNIRMAATIELANLGFIVDPSALTGISAGHLSKVIKSAREIMGADRNWTPIYPGFPKQVQELSTTTLLVEQILHYLSGGTLLPDYPQVLREGLPLEDALRNAREIKVALATDVTKELLSGITHKGIAMSPTDRDMLIGLVKSGKPELNTVASIIKGARNSENAQALVLALMEAGYNANDVIIALSPVVRNADSLLRLVLATATRLLDNHDPMNYRGAVVNLLNDCNGSVHMVTISKPARRAILNRLGQVTKGYNADSLLAHSRLWRRVMRMVHPYSIAHNADTARALDIIHENIEHRTYNSVVEAAFASKDAGAAISIVLERPATLLAKLVAILRLDPSGADLATLTQGVRESKVALTSLITAYNGVIAVNDKHQRVTRAAGRKNVVREVDERIIPQATVDAVISAIKDAIVSNLVTKGAPQGPVGVVSDEAVALVRRDLSITDRVMDRGSRLALAGSGDTLRIFSHWTNTFEIGGYMDIAATVLNEDMESLGTCNWSSWASVRSWGTYSGDKFVYPGDSAAEFVDVNLNVLKTVHPEARWIAMSIQSWSGFRTSDVDIIAGAMLRSDADAGEVFDARTVTTAFRPTTDALQSVPLVVDLESMELVWVDSSNGSNETGVSAANDDSVGSVVYDEIVRERLTYGDLASLWAQAHGVETAAVAADTKALSALLA